MNGENERLWNRLNYTRDRPAPYALAAPFRLTTAYSGWPSSRRRLRWVPPYWRPARRRHDSSTVCAILHCCTNIPPPWTLEKGSPLFHVVLLCMKKSIKGNYGLTKSQQEPQPKRIWRLSSDPWKLYWDHLSACSLSHSLRPNLWPLCGGHFTETIASSYSDRHEWAYRLQSQLHPLNEVAREAELSMWEPWPWFNTQKPADPRICKLEIQIPPHPGAAQLLLKMLEHACITYIYHFLLLNELTPFSM